MTGLNDANPFWDFSLEFYGRGEVAQSCLALQDRFGADVNILLYCCWGASEGAEEMARAELAEIISAIEPWQSGVVQRLRLIRRDMKQADGMNLGALSEDLRQAIKKCELEGEKIEQTILYQSGQHEFIDSSASPNERAKNATLNMTNYLQIVSADALESSDEFVQTIAQEIMP